jgi:hypothetical protein
MPRDGANLLSPGIPELPVDLLWRATRVRQHARSFVGDPMEKQLEQYADELESRARQIGRSPTDISIRRQD